jgi:hypothetical protein
MSSKNTPKKLAKPKHGRPPKQMMTPVTIAGYVNAYLNCNMETMKK